MTPIETLKEHNEWRRGSNTEMLNPTNLGIVIDTVIADYEAMQKQNDELRAKIDEIQEAYMDFEIKRDADIIEPDSESHSLVMKAIKSLSLVMNKTPAQSLSDIRAEAVMSIIKSDLGFSHTVNDFESEWVYSEDDIKDHANRIKEG